jgi:hypothetical protein
LKSLGEIRGTSVFDIHLFLSTVSAGKESLSFVLYQTVSISSQNPHFAIAVQRSLGTYRTIGFDTSG